MNHVLNELREISKAERSESLIGVTVTVNHQNMGDTDAKVMPSKSVLNSDER